MPRETLGNVAKCDKKSVTIPMTGNLFAKEDAVGSNPITRFSFLPRETEVFPALLDF